METKDPKGILKFPTQTTQIEFIGMKGTVRFTNIPKRN
jgi:hypothetical protein